MIWAGPSRPLKAPAQRFLPFIATLASNKLAESLFYVIIVSSKAGVDSHVPSL